MERKNIYFVSDFHFGLESAEKERIKEDKAVRFLQSIAADAKRVVLLGDIFDFWWEYKAVIPKGFVRFQAQIADMVRQGIIVDYFVGNHDLWQNDYFAKELGVNIYRKKYQAFVFDKKTFVLGHGDGLDPKDIGYKIMDAVFSARISRWLFSLLPSCAAISIARYFSRKNRRRHKKYDTHDYKEKEPMYIFCQNYLKQSHADFFVFGHRHIKNVLPVGKSSLYVNTGAWIEQSPYAVWDGKDLKLNSF
ncbi:MAG: UDP-2,3-diacylglucosamine diphosphatase [Bacteroidales bacterium]|nr:UDP-2,3-diacylglucosamine diphosphatase [Bacteroidales bacterium]